MPTRAALSSQLLNDAGFLPILLLNYRTDGEVQTLKSHDMDTGSVPGLSRVSDSRLLRPVGEEKGHALVLAAMQVLGKGTTGF